MVAFSWQAVPCMMRKTLVALIVEGTDEQPILFCRYELLLGQDMSRAESQITHIHIPAAALLLPHIKKMTVVLKKFSQKWPLLDAVRVRGGGSGNVDYLWLMMTGGQCWLYYSRFMVSEEEPHF